ncbi:MFS transporter [Candidatus Poribacteria bacterium]|nr:MFS transporter [Candidatus Poribacteria bacterium]
MKKFQLGWSRDFKLLAVTTFCLSAGFAIYSTTFNNFIVNELGIKPGQYGFMESLREIPGFLSAAFAALAMRLATPTLAGVCLVVMGFGMGSYVFSIGIGSLLASSMFWSIGFHGWSPLQSTLTLGLSDQHKGKRFGELQSTNSMGTLITIAFVWVLIKLIGYRSMFVIAGSVVTFGGLVTFLITDKVRALNQPRLVLKKSYSVYYALAFLQGCRRQITGFAVVFALVREYHTGPQGIAVLMFINTVAGLIFAPIIGRLIDKIGERKSLSIGFIALALIFWGYSSIQNRNFLFALYCLDNLMFLWGIAVTTYLNRIAPPEDIRPTLSMGVTMDHIAAVIVPFVSGLIWEMGYTRIFKIGTVIVLISLIVTQKIRK